LNTNVNDPAKNAYTAPATSNALDAQRIIASRGGRWVAVGAICGLLAVGFGAFGAHGLEDHFAKIAETDPDLAAKRLDNWRTAAQYHMHHSIAIVLAGFLMQFRSSRIAGFSAGFFTIGIVIFSGCLYTLVVTEIRVLGAVVPLGGLSFMVGWILLAIAAFKNGNGKGQQAGDGASE